jgi:hypothetical protein
MTYVGSDVPKEIAIPLLLARIMTHVKYTETGCWEWQGKKNSIGYAEATLGGKRYMVHRFVYEALTGLPVPKGFDICHSCHNRACLNPYHIRSDTHQANLMDASRAKRLNGQGKTHCKRGHPLEGDNLSPYTPFRSCVICGRGRYRLRLGWPEHLAFDPSVRVPNGYMMDRTTGQVVRVVRAKLASSNS